MKFDAEIKQLPQHNVLAMRHVGPYPEIAKVFERLFAWAGPKGLINFPQTQMLGVYHDDPETIKASKLRSDACLTVPEGTKGDDACRPMCIPGGEFAVAHVEIDQSEYGEAWKKLYAWIQQSDVIPASEPDRLCYEWYLNNPEEHPEKKHIVDICIPVSR